jgi:signal transduction histidine kinase
MTITARLTLILTLFAAFVLAGSGYAAWMLDQQAARRAARERAKVLARVLTLAAESELRDHGQLGAFVDLVTDSDRQRVIFYDAQGQAIAPVPTEEDPATYGRIRGVIDRQRPSAELFEHAGRTVFVYRTPLFDPRRNVAGALELRLNVDASAEREWAAFGLAIGLGMLALFGLLVAIYTKRWVGRPIRQLRDGMDHVIRGDLTHVLPLDNREEIGRIAYRFNEMTARLRAAQDEIRVNAETKLQLESRLRRSEKLAAIGQLSAEIAHEVGTPLNVIGGRAGTLQRKAEQPDEVRKNAQIITEQVQRITKIIEQVLDLARAPTPQHETVSLPQLIDDSVGLLEHQSQRARVAIAQDHEPGLPEVTGDGDGLRQVVLNLLVNAIQAMPDGGQLEIRTELTHRRKGGLDLAPPQHYVALSVQDEGTGISAENRARVFDPFFTTKAKGEGTGLGLTVVHGIVKAHDGWIDIEAVEPRGTKVTVYLPYEREGTEETEPVQPSADHDTSESVQPSADHDTSESVQLSADHDSTDRDRVTEAVHDER